MKDRLQKIIARAGVTSRRGAEQLIEQGRVRVNGATVVAPGFKADASRDMIEIDGTLLEPPQNKVYIILHKPPGYMTTLRDPQNRPAVASLLHEIPERIFPVGRLDFDTEGLLVMTNDGAFAQLLQHPRYRVARTYRVKLQSLPGPETMKKLRQGVDIDGEHAKPARLTMVQKTARNCWVVIVLMEGRYRQIKKMFQSVGLRVLRIIRTAYGPLRLGRLPIGAYRFMNKKEIQAVKRIYTAPDRRNI